MDGLPEQACTKKRRHLAGRQSIRRENTHAFFLFVDRTGPFLLFEPLFDFNHLLRFMQRFDPHLDSSLRLDGEVSSGSLFQGRQAKT